MKSIKSKIAVVYVFLAVIMALIGIISVLNLYRLANSINGLMTDNYKSIKSISLMNDSIEKQNMALLNYIYTGNRNTISGYLSQQSEFYKWYETAANNLTEKGEARFIKLVKSNYLEYQSCFSELRKLKDDKGEAQALHYYYKSVTPIVNSIRSNLQSITTLNENAMFSGKTRVNASAINSMYVMVAVSVLFIVCGLAVAFFLTNRFLKPLYTLQRNMQLVGEGNIKQEVQVNTNDEIGSLSLEFNKMMSRLQKFEQSTKGKLLDEKNRSVAIVKSISDPLIVLDTDFRVVLLNKACEQFFDISETNVVGKHFLEVIRNNDIFDHVKKICLSEEEKHIPKIIAVESKEKQFYFDTTVTRIRNEHSVAIGVVVLFQNVTKLKKLEKAKTEFVSIISHELKTPLTSIMMGTSLIRGEGLGKLNEKQLEIVHAIEDDTQRLAALVNDVIHLSKIESERDVYHIEPCSLSAITENCVKTFTEITSIRGLNLISEVKENLPPVLADREKITWVINNLISNASKYTNAGDFITIRAEEKDRMMHVTVSDTGSGIPAEYLDKIFERFVKVQTLNAEPEGTGLGLSIAKEIVSMHKGSIWCESRLDEGSAFTFTLPLADR